MIQSQVPVYLARFIHPSPQSSNPRPTDFQVPVKVPATGSERVRASSGRVSLITER
jgi:hypothetical protein